MHNVPNLLKPLHASVDLLEYGKEPQEKGKDRTYG